MIFIMECLLALPLAQSQIRMRLAAATDSLMTLPNVRSDLSGSRIVTYVTLFGNYVIIG